MKVLVFGSLNIDYVYQVKHFVQPGETLSSEKMQKFCGGKGMNQAVAFAKSGVDTWHAGAVGVSDSEMLLETLQKAGVHPDFVQKKVDASGHAIIQTTPEGENCILLFGGANQSITKADVDLVMEHFEKGDYLMLQNEINQIPYIMEKAHEIGMEIVLNPSPMDEKIFEMPLEYVDHLILNEVEGQSLCSCEQTDEIRLIDELTKKFAQAEIVLTLGKKGSVYGYKEKRIHQPIFPVKTVDTTAAGDTFTGFYIGSRILGKSVEKALETAAKASAIAVSRAGASPSIPTMSEVINLNME